MHHFIMCCFIPPAFQDIFRTQLISPNKNIHKHNERKVGVQYFQADWYFFNSLTLNINLNTVCYDYINTQSYYS